MAQTSANNPIPLSPGRIARLWWPLALSWLLMSIEGPAHSAVVARLEHPEVNLAAWGGIVYPLSLIIESPIVMLLSASTALCKDWHAYVRLRRITVISGLALSLTHALVAFTPLYDLLARRIIGAPEAIIEPGRIGLMIMVPWSAAIAYRRFQQGAMIRFGHTRAVGTGTVIRMTANGAVLLAGYLARRVPGIVVASTAVAAGVTAEALYAGLRVRSVVRDQIRWAPRQIPPFTLGRFLPFYIPLALTSLISFFVSPIGSAAMSRMPLALSSLAAWPVISGLIFMLRSPGLAYSEVTVALLDEPRSFRRLQRFGWILGAGAFLVAIAVTVTPLSALWLGTVMGLPTDLRALGAQSLWLALPLPPLALLQSWYQGIIVNSTRTRGVTESVVLYMAVTSAIMVAGVVLQRFSGLHVTVLAFLLATVCQVLWLWYRSRRAVRALALRDSIEEDRSLEIAMVG